VNCRFFLILVALALGDFGCQNTAFRVVDGNTGKPISGVEVIRLERHGRLMRFMMMLPAGSREVEHRETDAAGRVAFRSTKDSDRYVLRRNDQFMASASFWDPSGHWYASDERFSVELNRIGEELIIPLPVPRDANVRPVPRE
jgi:hypothetical protein